MPIDRTHRDLYSDLSNLGDADVTREHPSSRPVHVGIIGAGLAGLRCADVLLQNGIKVTILEARNRLGGRIAQSDRLGHTVDLGANWIHGTDNNPIFDIAKRTGTAVHALDEEQCIVDSDGTRMDAAEAEEYTTLMWEDVIAEAFQYSNDHQESIDPRKSLYDFFVEKAEGLFLADTIEEARRKRAKFLQIVDMWGAYVGSPVSQQSLRFFWLEQTVDGENLFASGTYSKILEEVSRSARANAEIKLNCEVVQVRSEGGDSCDRITLVDSEGLRTDFDEVVVTTPLGWLKRNQNAFHPALPSRLSQAIEAVGYGCLDKIYVTFPAAFWDQVLPASETISRESDADGKVANLRATTVGLHQPTLDEASSHYPGFTHWVQPSFAPEMNSAGWSQECMNLAALGSDCAHPTLLFYIYGETSQYIAKIVAEAQNEEECHRELVEFVKPYYSRLPNYSVSDKACTPKAILATVWANDKFAGYGAYSNFQVGLEKGDEDMEVMRRGLPERRIWFAGEHTAPFIATGTSTGAYWSGDRLARRIVHAYKMTDIQ